MFKIAAWTIKHDSLLLLSIPGYIRSKILDIFWWLRVDFLKQMQGRMHEVPPCNLGNMRELYLLFFTAQKPLVGQASRSHTNTPHSIRLLWTGDQPDAEPSTYQHTTLTRETFHAPGGIRTHNPSKRGAADPCLISANNIHNDMNMWDAEENLKNVSFVICTPHYNGLRQTTCIMHNR
jgi:hypothetical protein